MKKMKNIYPHKGHFIQTFANAGRLTRELKHYEEHLQCLIEHAIEPFNDVYYLCSAKSLIDSRISMTKITKFFSSGLNLNDGSFFKSMKTLHTVISNHRATLGEPSWSLQKAKAVGEDGATGEDIAYAYRDRKTCIQYLLRQSVFADDMVFSPMTEFDTGCEQYYSELHTANWWWEMQVDET